MKINNINPGKIPKTYEKQKKEKTGNNKKTRSDSMDISSQAKKIKELETRLQELPAIRKKRVEKLKTAINKGEYSVDFRDIAEKIINELEQE